MTTVQANSVELRGQSTFKIIFAGVEVSAQTQVLSGRVTFCLCDKLFGAYQWS